MADYRAIAWNIVERIDTEIADSDTLNVGNIAPQSGRLTIGGSAGTPDVYVANGHDFQVWGAGAEFRVDGGADALIQGSGSFQVPATGTHRIYGGTLSLEVPTNLSATLSLVNGQTITTTNNGDIDLDPHGTGIVNIGSNFYATGFDLGDPANRAGTLYADTLNANNIIGAIASCSTSCNVWEVNNDAATATPEDTGIALPAATATNIENWQVVSVGAAQDLHFRYKQDPTDPADLSEAGYLTALILGQNGAAQLTGSLGVSGTTIQFSGGAGTLTAAGGDLTLAAAAGANDILANASLVDLQTNVTTLDVPAGTGFSIGGTPLTTVLWTATAVDTVFGGPTSNADAYHAHSTIIGDGTNSNVWQVNEDVAGGIAEQAGTVWLAADGSDVLGWRHRAATSGTLYLEHKTNPADPSDLTEIWTPFVEYDPTVNELRSNGNLIFPNGGFLATTNNGSLTVNVNGSGNFAVNSNNWDLALNGNVTTIGTQHNFTTNGIVEAQAGRLVLRASTFVQGDAPLVDLRTSVTTLDVPSGTGFSIGGTALTTTLWTAAGVDAILGGPASNADAYHTHSTIIGDGTNSNVWQVNEDVVAGTQEYAGSVWLDGDGATNVEGWRVRNDGGTQEFKLQYKQNPTDPSDLTETWTDILTGTPTSVTVNAPTFNATTINATTITGTFTGTIAACGTSCNVWEVNNDAVGTTAEDVGVAFPGGDGVDVQNFQFFNNTSTPEMVLRVKQNPTDPADLSEAGYTTILQAGQTFVTITPNVNATNGLDVTGAALTVDANGIDSGGSIDLAGTLSFDAAGTIDTSGNNDLTINTGTQDVLVTAGTVDLRTNVTALDVPNQTGFSIGGTALTTTLWTATAVDTVFGGPASNADAYHTHSPGSIGSGTNANVWAVNQDAVATTAEDSAFVAEAGDGTNLQNWQILNDSSSKELVVQYKQDPTDPKDLAEAGYTVLMRLDGPTPQAQFPEEVLTENGLVVTNVGITITNLDIASAANPGATSYFNRFDLPITTSATVGVLSFGTTPALHIYGTNNTFYGLNSGNFSLTGTANTGIGENALTALTTGTSNVAVGYNAMAASTVVTETVAIGEAACSIASSSTRNTAVGWHALQNGAATDSVAIGHRSQETVSVGSNNVGVGRSTSLNLTAGSGNIAIGSRAHYGGTSGSNNIAIGGNSLGDLGIALTGSSNVCVGVDTGFSLTGAASGNVFLGYQSGYNETGSNKLYISNSSTATPLIGGDFSVPRLDINGDVLATGYDFGTSGSRLGDVFCTTLDATNLVADGTNSNVWVVNEDVVSTDNEQAGTVWGAADTSDVYAWRNRVDTTGVLHIEHKQNPTDLTDLAEGGWANWVEFDDGAAEMRVELDLVFPNGGLLSTTNNGNITINPNGTGSLLVNANLVDLQTAVNTLDVPDQTGFSIGGTALTTTLWTATAVDTVFGGPASNADAYHTHSGGGSASNQMTVTGLTTTGLSQYYAVYISGNNTVAHCDARDPTSGGSLTSATFAGVYNGVSGEIIYRGKVEVQFEATLTPVAGNTAFLSWTTPGLFTNVAPTNGSKDFNTVVGTILDNTNYAGVNRCVILISPDVPFQA